MTADADAPQRGGDGELRANPENVDAAKSAATDAAFSGARARASSGAPTAAAFAKHRTLIPSTENTFVYSMSTSGCSFLACDVPSAAMPPLDAHQTLKSRRRRFARRRRRRPAR